MSAPKWSVGMEVLAPGIYGAPDGIHVDEEEVCAALNVPYTETNRATIDEIVALAFKKAFPDIETFVVNQDGELKPFKPRS